MKQLLVSVIVFIVGAVIGGIVTASQSGSYLQQAWSISEMQCRADFGDRVWQAYREESPEVAIWALENYVQVLQKQPEQERGLAKAMQTDLVLAHVRLAILHRQRNDTERYRDHIATALALSNEVFPGKNYSEEELLAFVKRIDRLKND